MVADFENFTPKAAMQDEFSKLYNALFSNADHYINIVRALNSKKKGLTRTEIAQMTKGLVNTFVTTNGILPNKQSGITHSEIKMDDLFDNVQ